MRLDGILHDLRCAARALRRSPGFTLTALATLAVGIGVNAAVFSVTSGVLLKGFPLVEGNDRLVYIAHRGCCVAYADFEDWRAAATSFEEMAITHGIAVTFARQPGGFPESYTATEVSAGTFRLVGRAPMLGRDFVQADTLPGASPVVILRHSFWEGRLGGDRSIVGQAVRLNGVPTTVIGVMPPGFSFPQNQDFWVPLVPTPEVRLRENRNTWFVVARLADGVSIEAARIEMATIGSRLARAYPRTNAGLVPDVSTFREFFIGPNATLLYTVLWGAVSVVLLIACANLANLLLARAVGRSREMLVRSALGAGRARIVRQLLCESVLLSSAGGLAGWGLAAALVRLYTLVVTGTSLSDQISGDWFDHVLDYSVDARVLVYLAAVSIGTGLLFGLVPARRLAALDVNAALKEGGRGVTAGRGRFVSTWLIAGEMALAVVLLAGAGVLTRSFLNIYTADLGVRTDSLVTAIISLPQDRYPDAAAHRTFHERLEAGLRQIPGVDTVTIASAPPAWRLTPRRFEVAGAPPVDDARLPTAAAVAIGPDYFRALGTTVLAGREFQDRDGDSGLPAIVNRRFAAQQWPGQDPIGRRFRLFGGATPDVWRTVVGVAPDIAQDRTVELGLEPVIYLPIRQTPPATVWVIARTSLPAPSLAPAFRRAVHTLDTDLPLSQGPVSLVERVAAYQFRGVMAALLVAFAGIAVLLAALGLYAVAAYSVNQRTEEIGTRIAVGATSRDILALVLRQGLKPAGVGLVLGLVGSTAINGLLQSQLVRVSAVDPVTLVITTVVLVLAATLGCWIPARRATRVDPIIVLRHQ